MQSFIFNLLTSLLLCSGATRWLNRILVWYSSDFIFSQNIDIISINLCHHHNVVYLTVVYCPIKTWSKVAWLNPRITQPLTTVFGQHSITISKPNWLMLIVDDVKGRVEAAGCADPVAVCLRPPQAARQRLHALLPRRHQVGSPGKRSRSH